MRNVIWRLMASASAMIIFPVLGLAQFGSIAGVVKDNSGGILPNVTVEASSPVLIEKSRTAVSDASGQYRVDQLRPGTYTVTFTLPGFSTFRREGVEISEGFTAPVPATLNVGAVKDTITVEAQAPVVDVQDVSEHRTLVTRNWMRCRRLSRSRRLGPRCRAWLPTRTMWVARKAKRGTF